MKLNWFQKILKKVGLLKIVTETKEVIKEVEKIKEVEVVGHTAINLSYPTVEGEVNKIVAKVDTIVIPKELKGQVVLEIDTYVLKEDGTISQVDVETSGIDYIRDESKIIFKL